MMIEVPDEWREDFENFDKADQFCRKLYASKGGISRAQALQIYASFNGLKTTAWRDAAFRVWAGIRGIVESEGFFRYWETGYGQQRETDEDTDEGERSWSEPTAKNGPKRAND